MHTDRGSIHLGVGVWSVGGWVSDLVGVSSEADSPPPPRKELRKEITMWTDRCLWNITFLHTPYAAGKK